MERLANSFAAAALTPAGALKRFGAWSNLSEEELIARLNAAADELHVTSPALRWRLVTLGGMKLTVARSLPEAPLHNNGHDAAEDSLPLCFRDLSSRSSLSPSTGAMSRSVASPACSTSKTWRAYSQRMAPHIRSICEVTPHHGPVFVDTNVILGSRRVSSWRALMGGYRVETVEDCVTETQTGFQRRRPEQRAGELHAALAVIYSVGDRERGIGDSCTRCRIGLGRSIALGSCASSGRRLGAVWTGQGQPSFRGRGSASGSCRWSYSSIMSDIGQGRLYKRPIRGDGWTEHSASSFLWKETEERFRE